MEPVVRCFVCRRWLSLRPPGAYPAANRVGAWRYDDVASSAVLAGVSGFRMIYTCLFDVPAPLEGGR